MDTSASGGAAHRSVLLADDAYARYDFGPAHPLRPERLRCGVDLLRAAGLLRQEDLQTFPPATDDELRLVHRAAYVEALRRLSQWAPLLEAPLEAEARRYGLGAGDNPVFPEAYGAAAAIAGGSLHAALALLAPGAPAAPAAAGDAAPAPLRHVFHPMGGLHHAMPDRASGFCLCNDPALAIAAALRQGARVLYVDFDVHHGDGVEHCFDDDPRALTISFHESGEYLFPGTGDVLDLGRGAGEGFAVNVPLAPGTDDASWQAALAAVLPPLADRFRPQLVISQHGCDTHVLDPLADLRLTTASLQYQARLVHRLAHRHCAGRWLALGGGGYDVFRVVARSWALLWAEMAARPLPERLPPDWRERWQPRAGTRPLPELFLDPPGTAPPSSAATAAAAVNAATVEHVCRVLMP